VEPGAHLGGQRGAAFGVSCVLRYVINVCKLL
jgi:hypothetical protein